jgi:hypothetical protein
VGVPLHARLPPCCRRSWDEQLRHRHDHDGVSACLSLTGTQISSDPLARDFMRLAGTKRSKRRNAGKVGVGVGGTLAKVVVVSARSMLVQG